MSGITAAVDDAPPLEALPPEGMVATSHPRAADAAAEVLRQGGNAVDAAVTAAAVLGVVDPMSTSIGGDCFALVWDATERALHGYNGSGRAPKAATLADLKARGLHDVPERGILSVTVPGAVDAYATLLERFGKRSFADALAPAIEAAEGFALTPIVARDWAKAEPTLTAGEGADVYLPAPIAGQEFRQPALAASLRAIAEGGPEVFYRGALADEIAKRSHELGGWLTKEDLAEHTGEWVTPLEGHYRGHTVVELPPNGQGIVVLEALALLDEFPLADLSPAERAHLQIEALKIAFGDAQPLVGDPEKSNVTALLDPDALESRVDALEAQKRATEHPAAPRRPAGDTVYVAVVDGEGNACSLISSVYMHFGSGVVVDGICLQNRGALFFSDPAHPGALAPGARPYHTIIPAMVFRSEKPWLVFGVVGGFQQPQAQVQILVNLIDHGMTPQEAIDAPRFRWLGSDRIRLEDGFDANAREGLEARGHRVVDEPVGFGGAQAVLIESPLEGGSDPRKDGCVRRVKS
ncbi:MAG: gamma-glutamyltransferase family protein [Myxococcota bacterium]